MEPDNEGLKELKKEALALLAEMIEEIIQNGDFVEKFDDINQRMRERYGCVITNIVTSFVVKTSGAKATSGDQTAPEAANPPINVVVDDRKFLAALKIDSAEKEMNELRQDLNEARAGGLISKQPELLPGSQTKSTNDPRTVGRIINDIRTAARKLDLNSRQAAAKRINIEMGMYIPVADQSALLNDTFWLQQIQATINRIRELAGADDKIKLLLLSLEVIVKRGGSEL